MKRVELHIAPMLSDGDWDVLTAFFGKAERLIATKLVSSGESDIKGGIRYRQGEGLWFEAQLPPEEFVAEFLMAFRFFYLKKEKSFFPRALGVLGKHIDDPEVRQHFARLRERWENGLFGQAMSIQLNDQPMTAALLLDLWLNAHYFHADEDKAEKLEKLNEAFSSDFSKYMMLDGAFEAAKAVFVVFDSVKEIVRARASNP
ncbi:hypothetical protein JN531_013045 [Flagellatimonas centrodinii]|uniref:hypothetical protein n=1 Tax=Flagellatimonas centrodinii TaxID=2806210 RepID=UPI001FEF52BC|nr:hypothetical protein [Flagellatimonas centrodinii]ULQ46024.1 hypothetical protein JN531_013045 [Flagellatimonas centrodinii]